MRGPYPEWGPSSLFLDRPQELPSTPLPAVCSRGSHHFANDGSRYVSSNNLCKTFGKKGGHLLGNATSLPPWLFLPGQQIGHGSAIGH